MDFHNCFKFSDGMSATLQPKSILGFDIEFRPEGMQKYTHEVKMLTLNNPYELQVFSLTGDGYQKDIMFEGLDDKEDEVFFGDCIVGQEKNWCLGCTTIAKTLSSTSGPIGPTLH